MSDDRITHSPACVCGACCAERGGRSSSEVRVRRHWWGVRASGGTPAERRAALSKTTKKGAKEYRRTCGTPEPAPASHSPQATGATIGSLCIADTKPRRWTQADMALISAIGRAANAQADNAILAETA